MVCRGKPFVHVRGQLWQCMARYSIFLALMLFKGVVLQILRSPSTVYPLQQILITGSKNNIFYCLVISTQEMPPDSLSLWVF